MFMGIGIEDEDFYLFRLLRFICCVLVCGVRV